jgi:hypothetical protein
MRIKRKAQHAVDPDIKLLELIDMESAEDRNLRVRYMGEGVKRIRGAVPMRNILQAVRVATQAAGGA